MATDVRETLFTDVIAEMIIIFFVLPSRTSHFILIIQFF